MAAEDFGIRNEANQYMTALQVMPLFEGALEGLFGRYCESKVFQIDEAKAADFDRLYPEKEKVEGTRSQLRFLELVGMVRPYKS